MSDPAIKLFGKTIPLPELTVLPCAGVSTQELNQVPVLLPDPCIGDEDEIEGDDDGGKRESEKEIQQGKANECEEEQEEESLSHECNDVAVSTTSGITEKTETTKPGGAAKTDEESSQNDTGTCSQEAKLKKPDKILPCPRCNSMETKFCYYNNYNVNQPRHFCKKCQRYWTAGGTMRNVPVGAGRRKNKNPASHYNRHVSITSAEAMHKARSDVHHPNGPSLLTFGSDAVLCESMASGLNLAEKTMRVNEPEALKITIPCDNNPNPSTCTNPLKEEVGATTISTMPKVPCFPGPPAWPYAWNGVSWTVLPFYPPPPAYWSCPPGAWNSFTWIPQPNSPSGSGPNSPTLGKHSREENLSKPGTTFEETEPPAERSLWVPKTLRIDDPEEAAKSSIWETLGINKDKKEDTFRAFRSNKEKCNLGEAKPPQRRPDLQANPAAFSRSANFHESS